MIRRFLSDADPVILACGDTDFRKQIPGLVSMVTAQFQLSPHDGSYVFLFRNRKKNGIKVLRYDHNGFLLATKKLLDDMRFQWLSTERGQRNLNETGGMAPGWALH